MFADKPVLYCQRESVVNGRPSESKRSVPGNRELPALTLMLGRNAP
jgi:hypothetical protein